MYDYTSKEDLKKLVDDIKDELSFESQMNFLIWSVENDLMVFSLSGIPFEIVAIILPKAEQKQMINSFMSHITDGVDKEDEMSAGGFNQNELSMIVSKFKELVHDEQTA